MNTYKWLQFKYAHSTKHSCAHITNHHLKEVKGVDTLTQKGYRCCFPIKVLLYIQSHEEGLFHKLRRGLISRMAPRDAQMWSYKTRWYTAAECRVCFFSFFLSFFKSTHHLIGGYNRFPRKRKFYFRIFFEVSLTHKNSRQHAAHRTRSFFRIRGKRQGTIHHLIGGHNRFTHFGVSLMRKYLPTFLSGRFVNFFSVRSGCWKPFRRCCMFCKHNTAINYLFKKKRKGVIL